MTAENAPSLYPCRFPIKVIGASNEAFVAEVLSVFRARGEDLLEEPVRRTASGGGKYLSLTVHILARSRAHIDALYAELNARESVIMVL
jgi:uncharacterized protein